jgi:signal recognition particle subunit SEC65
VDNYGNCIECNKEVSCNCELYDKKYCNSCFQRLSLEGRIVPLKENTCNQSIERIKEILAEVKIKYKDDKSTRLRYNSILRSQIRFFPTDPCKYYSIINEM